MAEQWILRVEGKDYGPADLATLRDWKADGRVLPTNPARREDVDLWQTAGEIPGLFQIEPPPVQSEVGSQRSEIAGQPKLATTPQSAIPAPQLVSRPPSRNVLVETFRIYFRGFFQFFCLSLLSIVPILCAEFAGRFIDTAPGVALDLRAMVAAAFGVCMFVLRLVLIPIYIAGIQILSVELATGNRIGFLSVLNGAVKYWPRVAGLALYVSGVFFLLIVFALGIMIMVLTSAGLFSIVLALGLLVIQVWLFAKFFINGPCGPQFAVLETANAADALRESRMLARSGRDLPWYQRPIWRGGVIVSFWFAFVIALTIAVFWQKLIAEWPMYQDYFNQLTTTQDPQALLQKMSANLQTQAGFDYRAFALHIGARILLP